VTGMEKVYLYELGTARGVDLPRIQSYLSRVRGIEPQVVGALGRSIESPPAKPKGPGGARPPQAGTELAVSLAATRVHDLGRRESFDEPMPAEIAFMERQLTGTGTGAFGHMYDGIAVMSAVRSVLGAKDGLSLVFTNQIVGTWDEGDLRYHARVMVAGSPAIVSVPGVVLAPARPREYYLYQGGARAAGASEDEIEIKMFEVMGDRFVIHADPRIPEILKGYALQAVAYWIFGEGFCDDPKCRLFNAHWQEEMIRAQLGEGEGLCARHAALLGM
jgi:hypothetical protein